MATGRAKGKAYSEEQQAEMPWDLCRSAEIFRMLEITIQAWLQALDGMHQESVTKL